MFRCTRIVALLLTLSATLAGAAQSAPDAPDARELVRRAAENQKSNEKRARDYMYVERIETRKKGGPESRTSEIFVLYGERVKRLIAVNDKPLPEKQAAAEEARIAKLIEKRKGESESERQKREAKFEKEEQDSRAYLEELTDAYVFTLVGSEAVNGRDTWVVTADPRLGYRPKLKPARFLPKIRMKTWIDRQEAEVVKLEAEAIDNISIGVFLVKVRRGARLELEQTRINDEVWLPRHMAINGDARLLLKHLEFDVDVTCRDYRKFRADAHITGVVEEPPASIPPPQR